MRTLSETIKVSALLIGLGALSSSVGCGGEEPSDEAGDGDERTLEEMIEEFETCEPSDLTIAVPWMGPAFDPETGEQLEDLPEGYVVAAVQGWRKYDDENSAIRLMQGMAVMADLLPREDLLGVSVVESVECDISTSISMWKSEAAMYDFVLAPAHAEAMGMSSETLFGCEGAHWPGESTAEPPSWDEVKARLISEIRAGK